MSDVLDRLQSALADRYAIQRELGRGGMAIVFLAQDLCHKRRVALKVPAPRTHYLPPPSRSPASESRTPRKRRSVLG